MWAIVCREWGGPDVLDFSEIEEPLIFEGEVRIKVKASGVNFADSLI